MPASRCATPQNEMFRRCLAGFLKVFIACAVLVPVTHGQQQRIESGQIALPPEEHEHSSEIARLQDLLSEAERHNPQIQSMRFGWEAAKQIPSQVATRSDPQFTAQQVNVGSPRPFAGYTNSDFAYFGLGISQDFPYPGKLRLKGDVAARDADVVQQQYESVRRTVLAGVRSAYLQLAYLSQTLAILETDRALLQQVERAADARYRSGKGNQQDLLQAQLEQTKLLREITMHHLEVAKAQAQLKTLLNRAQSSPDIQTSDLSETPLPYGFDELLSAAKVQNPEIAGAQKMIEKNTLQVDLARKDFYPDFSVQYMWQRTDPTKFRAYWMLTLGVRVPIYRDRKQRPELAQSQAELSRSRSDAEAQEQQVTFEIRTAFETAQESAELLTIYREGLVPQAHAQLDAAVTAYQGGRQDFAPVLNSYLDVFHLDQEYWQSAVEHENALAELEKLTGISLHDEGASQ